MSNELHLSDLADFFSFLRRFSLDNASELLVGSTALAAVALLLSISGLLGVGWRVKRLSGRIGVIENSLDVLKQQEHRRFLVDVKRPPITNEQQRTEQGGKGQPAAGPGAAARRK